MGAGERIRAAAAKVAAKVPGCDRPVTFCVDVSVSHDYATGRRNPPTQTVLADIGKACEVRNLSEAKAVTLTGDYKAGDREFLIPAETLTGCDIRTPGAYLIYGTQPYEIVRVDEHDIAFGVVVMWRLVCRLKGATGG